MNKLNPKYLLLWALAGLFLTGTSFASDEVELSKRFVKGFKVSSGAQIDVSNKYGDVIINTWQKDSVRFEILITSYGKTDETVNKLIERVSFDHTNSGMFLKFETIFDRQSGSFKEFWNSLGDYSKVLINKNNLNIDFQIYLPEKSNLYLENKFGDVYMNEYSGRSKIVMSQGDIKISNQTGQLNLSLKFGNASIQNLNTAYLDLQIAEVSIEKARKVNVNSSSSTVTINDVKSLKINGRNDKYFLKNVTTLSGDATFSSINITNLKKELIGKANFSDLTIENFEESAKVINLNTKSTDIRLWLSPGKAYDVDLIAREDKLDLPMGWEKLNSYYTDSKNKNLRVSGNIEGENKAQIHIDNQGGSLIIFEK